MEIITFKGPAPGPHLVVLGAVHGNEPCGPQAIRRFLAGAGADAHFLRKGSVSFVPVVNARAYAENVRFIDRNLNRRLFPKTPDEIKAYEDTLDNDLCALLAQADFLLDIHSYHTGGPPFVFVGCHDTAEKDFALSLGIATDFVWGWSDAFRNSDAPERDSWGTTEYVRHCGGRGVTLECGQHLDPANADVGHRAIVNALAHLGMTDTPSASPPATPRFARMQSVVFNRGTRMAQDWRHFQPVTAGTLLAENAAGEKLTAKADGYIILPFPKASEGAELLYFATAEEPFPALS